MRERLAGAVLLAMAALFPALAAAAERQDRPGIAVSASHRRAQAGDRVELMFAGRGDIRAVLLAPGAAARELPLDRQPGGARATIVLAANASEGLYLVHAWTGPSDAPIALGKRAFLVGRIVLDFFIPRYLDASSPGADMDRYLDDFRSLGGNTVVAHALITPDKAYFPSETARTDIRRGSGEDMVERMLDQADRRGMAVFLSVSWDMTRRTPYSGRMAEITAFMDEMFALYAHHPSLAGFYSYQEGSGTYYVPYVREFTAHAKGLHEGLLTAVAPFLDDPLLAGYLSTVDTLDMMIYQGMVMASHRPDNRKLFPIRRVHDFAALGVGAKWLQDKFAVVHVELFAYLEKRRKPEVLAAAYEDIYRQILSVATASAPDGIALFAYGPHIHAARADPLVQRSRDAVRDGLAMFRRITDTASEQPSPLAVYVPYSDWIVERWTQSLVPAFDAFRRAGIAVDVLPYAPPIEESHYPYFPFHLNRDVLERLLRTRRVLVLPDVSGFQQTDSDLIDAFLKRGGTVIAFGPQIPMGRTYERDEVFGGVEAGSAIRRSIRVSDGFGRRLTAGAARDLSEPAIFPVWRPDGGRVLARFDDDSPAVLANRHGEGLAIAVLPSAASVAADFPELLREIVEVALDHARHPPLPDIIGLTEQSDLAVGRTADGFTVAVVNHAAAAQQIRVRPPSPGGVWTDLVSGSRLSADAPGEISLKVPAHDARLVRYRHPAEAPRQ